MMDTYSDQFEEQEGTTGNGLPSALSLPPQPMLQVAPIFIPPPDPLVELQRRLDIAAAYQSLVAESPFDQETSATREVWAEVRQFVSERLAALVGLTKPAVAAPGQEFSRDEFVALKSLARSVLARQQAPVADVRPATPTKAPRKAAKRAAAEPPPPPPPPAPPPTPVAPIKLSAPNRPTTKKVKSPTPTAPLAKSEASPAPVHVGPPAGTVNAAEPTEPTAPPPAGQKMSENVYTVKVRDEKGNIVDKKIRLNLTPQVRPVGIRPLPTPTKYEYETSVNGRATAEADLNAKGFVTKFEAARRR